MDEAPIKILIKYVNFTDIFLSKFIIKLSKHINIKNYTIKLVDD